MTSPDIDIANLTESQQIALGTYTSVTNQEPSAAIPLLRRSEWNVQIAIAKFFDGESADPVSEAQDALSRSPAPQPRAASTLINGSASFPDSQPSRNRDPAPRVVPQPDSQKAWHPPLLVSILLSPFNALTRLVGGSLSLIGYLLSLIPRLFTGRPSSRLGAGSRSGRKNLSPTDSAARFTREFEEEYGQHDLHFFQKGYAQAYDLAKRELKYLLIVLISPEHDDTSTFIRETLLSPEVVNYINDSGNNIILWAGSVQDSEAYQVSTALNCSKFPFAALVVHTPQDSSTAMSTIARLVGLMTPSAFVSKLRTARNQHSPALERARTTRNEQQASRNLREEQNSAYERSLAIDRERARERRDAEAAQRRAEQEAKAGAEAAEKHARHLEQWRRWRAQSIAPEPEATAKAITRISIRMTSGERVIRRFDAQADIEELYAFVECYEAIQAGDSSPSHAEKPEGFRHQYGFRLVSPMPRTVYEVDGGGSIGEKVGRSGNLIVEERSDDDGE